MSSTDIKPEVKLSLKGARLYTLVSKDGETFGYILFPDYWTSKDVNKLLRNGMDATAVEKELDVLRLEKKTDVCS